MREFVSVLYTEEGAWSLSAHHYPFFFSLLIALFILFIASGYLQQRTLDKWTEATGRAPMIHKGRGSWRAYLRSVKSELPTSVSKRIAIWGWVANLSNAFMWVIIILAALWNRH